MAHKVVLQLAVGQVPDLDLRRKGGEEGDKVGEMERRRTRDVVLNVMCWMLLRKRVGWPKRVRRS